jgi:cell division protein FtsQ
MSRARAATPAAKRRAQTGGAKGKRRAAARPKAARRAPAKSAPKKRATSRRAPAKTRRKTTRSTAPRRSRTRRRARARARWRRPRPLRALRRGVVASSWRYRLGVLVIVAAAGAAGYFLWLRDSSLVAVTDVEVAGVSSGDRERIVGELTRLAEQQTTLHVDPGRIERAAAAFPTIKAVSVDANFPHGMRIEVTERPPALVVEADGRRIAAAADGTLLTGVAVPDDGQLPVLETGGLNPSARALEGELLEQALIAGATPAPLKPLVHAVDFDRDHGVEVTLRGDIPVRFGSGARAAEKWAAAAAVLASPKVDALTYLDVGVPERPVAGGNA